MEVGIGSIPRLYFQHKEASVQRVGPWNIPDPNFHWEPLRDSHGKLESGIFHGSTSNTKKVLCRGSGRVRSHFGPSHFDPSQFDSSHSDSSGWHQRRRPATEPRATLGRCGRISAAARRRWRGSRSQSRSRSRSRQQSQSRSQSRSRQQSRSRSRSRSRQQSRSGRRRGDAGNDFSRRRCRRRRRRRKRQRRSQDGQDGQGDNGRGHASSAIWLARAAAKLTT